MGLDIVALLFFFAVLVMILAFMALPDLLHYRERQRLEREQKLQLLEAENKRLELLQQQQWDDEFKSLGEKNNVRR